MLSDKKLQIATEPFFPIFLFCFFFKSESEMLEKQKKLHFVCASCKPFIIKIDCKSFLRPEQSGNGKKSSLGG